MPNTTPIRKEIDLYGQYAYEQTLRLFAVDLSDEQKQVIFKECHQNESIRRLSGMYLVGTSDRAKQNKENLNTLLRKVFGIPDPNADLF